MASIGEKREWDVSEIEEGASVAVYGIPINVSPVRESRKKKGVYHFNAHLSDGKRCVCVVLFDTSHLEVMKKAMEGKVSVLVDDSLVKNMVIQELGGVDEPKVQGWCFPSQAVTGARGS